MKVTKVVLMGSAVALIAVPALASAQTAPAAPATEATGASAAGTTAPATGAAAGAPASSSAPAAAPAGTPVTLAQGTTVLDPQGGTVGTIQSVEGDFAVVATTKSKVRLPKSSFAMSTKGPVIGMTAAQLDAAAGQAAPQATASTTPSKPNVVKGAAVADTQGGAVGTVEDVDSQFATVSLTTGGKVRLPVSAFGAGANGGLRVAMTAAQLSAAAGASKGG